MMTDKNMSAPAADGLGRRDFMTAAAAIGLAGMVPASALAADTAPGQRLISADLGKVKGAMSTVWRRCISAGRVGEMRYAVAQDQLRQCKAEIGFEYLRCHGLFHDELGVYSEDRDGKPVYNFHYVDLVYDFLLSIGVRPFVEFGFMPDALATIPTDKGGKEGTIADPTRKSGKRAVSVFQWRSNVTPPRDPKRWGDLVSAITRHWIERYGRDEVRQWFFEVWNEPNHPAFWSPNDESKRKEEYFELFKLTSDAVKAVDPTLHVGGPSGAGPVWIPELIAYCVQNKVGIDFITYHAYGNGRGATGFDGYGDQLLYLNKDVLTAANFANAGLKDIAASARPDLPVHITEWSASYSSRDPVHDDYISAPYILEQLRNTERTASMSYWIYGDVLEEVGIPPRAFHGGNGLLTLDGIRKPAFYAYRYLAQMGAEELANGDGRSWLTRNKDGSVQALFWDMTMPNLEEPNQTVFRQIRPSRPVAPVTLSLAGLKPGRYRLRIEGTGFERQDAYTAWLKMGAPDYLSFKQAAALKEIAAEKPMRETVVQIGSSGTWSEQFPMRERDVMLVTLKRG